MKHISGRFIQDEWFTQLQAFGTGKYCYSSRFSQPDVLHDIYKHYVAVKLDEFQLRENNILSNEGLMERVGISRLRRECEWQTIFELDRHDAGGWGI